MSDNPPHVALCCDGNLERFLIWSVSGGEQVEEAGRAVRHAKCVSTLNIILAQQMSWKLIFPATCFMFVWLKSGFYAQ